MQMDEGLDTGDMLLVESIDIADNETSATLHDRLSELGSGLVVRALDRLEAGGLTPVPQPPGGVTYAAKLDKAEAVLDLSMSASDLARKVRAFNPVPGASLTLPGVDGPVKVWNALALDESSCSTPGSILRATSQGIDLSCGEGVLRLLELQRPGGKRQPVEVFVQGWSPFKQA
jgi:methionyl-tRNA formyltransferase